MARLSNPMIEELSRTSTSLLCLAREGDEEGWKRLVDEYAPRVFRWCRREGLEIADSADVAQEVFSAIAKNLDRFRRDRDGDSFRKWIRTITMNKIRDHWRKQKRTALPVGGSSWQDRMSQVLCQEWGSSSSASVEKVSDDARHRAVEQVRYEVSSRDWGIFTATIVDEQSPQDVADLFSTTVNVVYLVKSRILRRLRNLANTSPGIAATDK